MHLAVLAQAALPEVVEQEESIANVVVQVVDLTPMAQMEMVVLLVADLIFQVALVVRLITLEVMAVAVAHTAWVLHLVDVPVAAAAVIVVAVQQAAVANGAAAAAAVLIILELAQVTQLDFNQAMVK
jgi:hypothetical protein